MQILARTHSSAEYPLANYMLIDIDDMTAAKLLRWHKLAEGIDQSDKDFLRIEFWEYSCEAMEDLPDELAEQHEDALCDVGYVVLDEPLELPDEILKRRDFSLVQVEAHHDIPSLNGFRWEFGVKHANHSVETAMIPLDLVRSIVQP